MSGVATAKAQLSADIARYLAFMSPNEAIEALDQVERVKHAEVFGYLPLGGQVAFVEHMPSAQLARLIETMSADERADFLHRLGDELRPKLLAALEHTEDARGDKVTEGFHKGGAITAHIGNLRDATIGLLYRKRVFWLVLLVFGNLFSGAGIAAFEDVIAANIALVFFLPLLVDSGGNAGAQSATLMVRALATGEVVLKDWVRLLGHECLVALALGTTMAAAVALLGVMRGGPAIAVIVASSMVIIVILGSVIGMSLPFLLSRLRLDPATASGPLITSIADAAGVLVYFAIATQVLELYLFRG